MTEQSDKPSVDGLMMVVEAFGQACKLRGVRQAQGKPCDEANAAIFDSADEIRAYAARLAALAGPLEQPQEPTSDQANLAQASGVCDLQTALPEQPSRRREDWLLWDRCYARQTGKNALSFLDCVSLFADVIRREAVAHKQEVDLLQTDAYAEGRRDEQEELASVLPGTTYMDPPDGGAPTILEQLQRQAKDAARYLWLREVVLRFDAKRQGVEVYEFVAPIAYGPNIDVAIDAAIVASEAWVEPVVGLNTEGRPTDKPAASSESSVSVPKEQQ